MFAVKTAAQLPTGFAPVVGAHSRRPAAAAECTVARIRDQDIDHFEPRRKALRC